MVDVTGGVGGLTLFDTAPLGISNKDTFLTGNVGGGEPKVLTTPDTAHGEDERGRHLEDDQRDKHERRREQHRRSAEQHRIMRRNFK